MSTSLLFNHATADYTSPAYLARQARCQLELLALRRCRTVRPEIMRLTAKPKLLERLTASTQGALQKAAAPAGSAL